MEIFSFLRVRIFGAIFLIFLLAIGMVLYGIWTYQSDKLIDMMSQRTIQMSDMIVAGLRSSMLQNDRAETMRSINQILEVAGTSKISVLNENGVIVLTSDQKIAGKIYGKMANPACTICHTSGRKLARTISFTDDTGEKYITTVTPIKNEPACHGCHNGEKKNIGILMVESPFGPTTAMLKELAQRIILTGIFVFCVGVLLLNYIVTRFFTKPIEELEKGFEKVSDGDFTYWVDVKTGGEIGYMVDLFNVMSRAIERYVAEIKEKTQEVSAHYTIVDILSKTIEKKKLKDVAVDLLINLLDAECVALAIAVEKHSNIFEMVTIRRGDKRHYHGYFNIDSGDPETCAFEIEHFITWRKGEYQTYTYLNNDTKLLIPLLHENLSMGILLVEKTEEESFSPAEKKIVPVLMHHIAIAFANAQLYDMAITDGLTTLYTKRHFLRKLSDYVENFHTSKRGFCLLMLDLDHFKAVNDKYGHPVGDKVLMEVAGIIRSNIRHGDLPFRFGGEEFAVLFKGDDINEAFEIAERVRSEVEKKEFRYDDISFRKTISIGLACFPVHFDSADEIVSAADSALYRAKNGGRNQVVVFSAGELFSEAETNNN